MKEAEAIHSDTVSMLYYWRMEIAEIRRKSLARLIIAAPALGLMFFLSAGTLHYWQAWVILAEFIFISIFVFIYFIKRDPTVLERRIKFREHEPVQKWITAGALPFVVAAFLLPGLDKRFGWSDVPLAVEIAALVLVMLGYLLFFFVLKENRFAARTVRIEEGQSVIRTGPYAMVRHPMYTAGLLTYLPMPLALGSWWAFLPSLIWPLLLAVRSLHEEKILTAELNGYADYARQVQYRLIPGFW